MDPAASAGSQAIIESAAPPSSKDDLATSYEAEKAADQAAQTVEDSEEKHDLTLIIIAAVAGVGKAHSLLREATIEVHPGHVDQHAEQMIKDDKK